MIAIPRLFLFSIVTGSGFLHWLIGFYYQTPDPTKKSLKISFNRIQVHRLIFSFFLLLLSFILIFYYKIGSITYYTWMEQIVLLLIGLWFISGYITRKFYVRGYQNLYYKIAPIIKSQVLFLLLASGIFYFLALDHLSRQLFFGTIIIFSFIESFFYLLVFINKENISYKRDNIIGTQNKIITNDKNLLINNNIDLKGNLSIEVIKQLSKLENKVLTEWIIKKVSDKGNKIKLDTTTILATSNPANYHYLSRKAQNLVINLNLVNDFKSINKMFLTMKKMMNYGGVYIGSFSPLEEDYQKINDQMPKFLFILIYPIHFIIYRVFPKLPFLGMIYEYFTKGQGRFISKAEVFGRLSYCGFKVEDTIMIDHNLYFISWVHMEKSKEKNPSFGPLVKLKRVGYNNELIDIYKFRTMHPYSEFIQKDVFEQNSLDQSGKLKNDFRVTSWGKVLRKLWIDEIPQIYNWLRGDISLVGVRALSKHYFSLYPEDLQKLRTKFKPGLVPPYYADMPNSFDEIISSERQFIDLKIKKGIIIDFIYFFKAFQNIVFKGARSR
jgi:hypothetical protein